MRKSNEINSPATNRGKIVPSCLAIAIALATIAGCGTGLDSDMPGNPGAGDSPGGDGATNARSGVSNSTDSTVDDHVSRV